MNVPNLKDEVKDNKKVRFKFYRSQNLWYETESGFVFPVPIDDIGEATFLAEDKAILFMRYIRNYIAEMKDNKIGHEVVGGTARPCIIDYAELRKGQVDE